MRWHCYVCVTITITLRWRHSSWYVTSFGIWHVTSFIRYSFSGSSGQVTRSSSLEAQKSGDSGRQSGESTYIGTYHSGRHMSQYYADDIDTRKERRIQRYLVVMVTIFAVCWCVTLIVVRDKCRLWSASVITHLVHGKSSPCISVVRAHGGVNK